MSIPLYILKRILASIPTLLAVSIIGFFLMRYDFTIGPINIPAGNGQHYHIMDSYRFKNPIDPLGALRTNQQISRAAIEAEEKRMGLDKPMHVQYWLWLTNLFKFHPDALASGNIAGFFTPDLGKTFNGEDVTDVLGSRAGNTLLLNILTILVTWAIALPLGIYASLHWRSYTDRMMTVLAAVGMSFPAFVLALIIAVFAVQTGWFPFGGLHSDAYDTLPWYQKILERLHYLVLPVFVLTIGGLSSIQRQMRGNLLDVLGSEYIRTARAKGLPENVVIYRHALRNAINPLITIMGYEFAALLGGSILIETVLGYPGLGQLTYRAALETDTNLMMASLIMSAGMLVLGNLVADILLKFADPRIELS